MKRRLVPVRRFLVEEKPLTQTKETAAMREQGKQVPEDRMRELVVARG